MPITISGSTGIAGVDGSAATPAVQGTDTNTGEFFPAADTIAWTTGGTERMRLDTSGNLLFNSGYGSVATAYGCRAWVKFNGTGTLAINGSGNVSSVTDNGVGDFTVNFSTSMPDTNYSTVALGNGPVNGQHCQPYVAYSGVRSTYSTSAVAVAWFNATNSASRADPDIACVSIFR